MAETTAAQSAPVRKAGGFFTYLKNVKAEMEKVVWPTKAQVKTYTIVTMVATLLVAVSLGAFDKLCTMLIEFIIQFA